MFAFAAGAIAGAGAYRMYNSASASDEGGSTRARGRRDRRISSRATILNRTLGYNMEADETDASHVNFLSDIVARLWPYMRIAIADAAKASVEPSFAESLPGPLSTLKFKKLDLGEVPFVIDNILVRELRKIDDAGRVYGKDRNYLQFEWDITWQSECDIQLATDKIAKMAAISFGIKTLTLSGRLQVIAKPLSTVLPCIDAVQFAFVNPPKIDLDFTGLANVADMKFLKGAVRSIVDDILASSMVLPTRIPVALGNNVDYRDIFCPQYKGMARIRLHGGRGFEVQKASTVFGKDDIPDVYVKIRLGVEPWFTSSVCKDNCNPHWDPDEEFQDFLACAYRDQIVEIQAWDEDTGTLDTDDFLGFAYVTLGQIMLDADPNGVFEFELLQEGAKGCNEKHTGQFLSISMEKVGFTTKDLTSMSEFAVNQYSSGRNLGKALTAKARKKQEEREGRRIIGLYTILVSHARNLPFPKAEEANTFVKVYTGIGIGKKEIGATVPIPGMLNPEYMTPISKPVTVASFRDWNKSIGNQSCSFELLQQDLKTGKIKSLGEIVVDQSEVKVGDEWALRETRSLPKYPKTTISFTITFAGVDPRVTHNRSFDSYRSAPSQTDRSVGIEMVESIEEVEQRIRVTIVKGYGFRAERKKRLTRKLDIPDVYCMIKYGSSPSVWRTPTIQDTVSPRWDNEYKDFKMESMNEVISIEVWDENSKTDDHYYGSARTSVAKVLMNNGILDVAVRPDSYGNKKGTPKKKSMAESNMYITVQCQKM